MPPQNMQQNSTDKEIQATIVCEVVVAEIMPVVGEGIDLFMTDLGLEYVACGIEEAKASGRGFDSYLKMNLSPIFSIGDEDNVVRRWDIQDEPLKFFLLVLAGLAPSATECHKPQ